MCTVAAMQGDGLVLGRNMDLDGHFGERVVFVPRKLPFSFRLTEPMNSHYAMLGMATVVDGAPLFADAMNEAGLCMAGLRFADYARYAPTPAEDKLCLAPFELFWYLLGRCRSVDGAREILQRVCVTDLRFSSDLPNAPMHWMLADARGALVVESTAEGLQLYDDPYGVLTNAPPFDRQAAGYEGLSDKSADALTGGFSSTARFSRAAWLLSHMTRPADRDARGTQMQHLLANVAMPHGSVRDGEGKAHYTTYSAVMDTLLGRYSYTDYLYRKEAHSFAECALSGSEMQLFAPLSNA